MSKHNLELLAEAARLLKPLLGELVFVGGSTTTLLITDKAAAEVRPTYDVDAIAEISSYVAYADFSERLRRCGFSEDASEGAPICRWRLKKTILDVMPPASTFSDRIMKRWAHTGGELRDRHSKLIRGSQTRSDLHRCTTVRQHCSIV